MVVNASFLGSEGFVLLPFLDTCSKKLTVFQVSGFECFKNEMANEAPARLDIFLEELDCGDMPQKVHSHDWEFAEAITVSSRGAAIYVNDCFEFRSQSATALLNTLNNSRRFVISVWRYFEPGTAADSLYDRSTGVPLAIDDRHEQPPYDPILDART